MKARVSALVVIFCLVSSISVAGAATLTKVSGTFTNGQSITVTGSGFGTAPTDASFIDAESGAVGNPIVETGWSRSTASAEAGGPWTTPVYSSTKALNGTKSIKCALPSGVYGCTFDVNYPNGVGKLYLSYWIYADYKKFPPENHFQWKTFRFTPTDIISGTSPDFGMSIWPSGDGSCYQAYHTVDYPSPTGTGDISLADVVPDKNIWRSDCMPRGEWYRMEVLVNESDPLVANGTQVIKYYSTSKNAWVTWSNYVGNIITRSSADKRYRWLHIGEYIGNPSTGKDVDIYWDNVYVQRGTYARFELCDSSSWSTCKKRQVQQPTQWSSSSVVIKFNQGPFTSGQQTYLYFIDDAGNASNGLLITTGSSAAKTPTTLKRRW